MERRFSSGLTSSPKESVWLTSTSGCWLLRSLRVPESQTTLETTSFLDAGSVRLVLHPSPSSGFTVLSAFKELAAETFAGTVDLPYKFVWRSLIPSKICNFLWNVFHKRILTLDNLKKRGTSLPNRCALCKQEEESINHIFVSCMFAEELWNILKSFIKVVDSVCRATDITDRINSWNKNNPADPAQWTSRVFLHAFCWNVWLERNARIFNELEAPSRVVAFRIGSAIAQCLTAAKKVDREISDNWLNVLKLRLFPPRN
ncbi:unnamed protein product [Linum trigynum]|uniref:Reverse transcriptase zinc-binding domain-containing protein n=1 Tax=Linum trigynum TaxID=586398 RepID=A0AAV2F4T2_9ROSI